MESVGATSHSYSLDLHFHIGNEILTLNFAFTEDFRTGKVGLYSLELRC